MSKKIEHLAKVVLKRLDYPATPSSSHGLLQQRRQQHWTTAVRTVYLNTRKRTPKRSCYVAVLSRSLLLANAVDIYLETKEGVPVRSKASQREGTGRSPKSTNLAQALPPAKIGLFFGAIKKY